MMDGDLQHPPGLIPTLLERWRAGSEIVNTVQLGTEDISESKKFFSRLFYRVFNLLANVEIEPGNADFRLMRGPQSTSSTSCRSGTLRR